MGVTVKEEERVEEGLETNWESTGRDELQVDEEERTCEQEYWKHWFP